METYQKPCEVDYLTCKNLISIDKAYQIMKTGFFKNSYPITNNCSHCMNNASSSLKEEN